MIRSRRVENHKPSSIFLRLHQVHHAPTVPLWWICEMNDAGWLVENYVSFRLFRVPNVTAVARVSRRHQPVVRLCFCYSTCHPDAGAIS